MLELTCDCGDIWLSWPMQMVASVYRVLAFDCVAYGVGLCMCWSMIVLVYDCITYGVGL